MREDRSLQPLDVGFDVLRLDLPVVLPPADTLEVVCRTRRGTKRVIRGDRERVVRVLLSAGYRIHGYETRRAKLRGEEEMTWEEAIEELDRILDDIASLPEQAEEFGDSVREGVEDMRAWIEENESVTDKQVTAIENWGRGVRAWL